MGQLLQVRTKGSPIQTVRVPGRAFLAEALAPSGFFSPLESKHPMDKRQLIEEIRRFNTTAQEKFLSQFDDAALQQYLDHLKAAHEQQLRIDGWVRRPKARMAS